MKQDDCTGPETSQDALEDALHVRIDTVESPRAPPDISQTQLTQNGRVEQIAKADRRTENAHLFAASIVNRPRCPRDFPSLRRRKVAPKPAARMVLRVIAKQMSVLLNCAAERGIRSDAAADEEENRLRSSVVENRENLRRIFSRAIVDREADFSFRSAE